MDNSAAVLKIVDTSVTPVFVQIGSLVPLTPVEAELDPIILKQSHGPPFSLLALGFDYPPLLGRSPPFLS